MLFLEPPVYGDSRIRESRVSSHNCFATAAAEFILHSLGLGQERNHIWGICRVSPVGPVGTAMMVLGRYRRVCQTNIEPEKGLLLDCCPLQRYISLPECRCPKQDRHEKSRCPEALKLFSAS